MCGASRTDAISDDVALSWGATKDDLRAVGVREPGRTTCIERRQGRNTSACTGKNGRRRGTNCHVPSRQHDAPAHRLPCISSPATNSRLVGETWLPTPPPSSHGRITLLISELGIVWAQVSISNAALTNLARYCLDFKRTRILATPVNYAATRDQFQIECPHHCYYSFNLPSTHIMCPSQSWNTRLLATAIPVPHLLAEPILPCLMAPV